MADTSLPPAPSPTLILTPLMVVIGLGVIWWIAVGRHL